MILKLCVKSNRIYDEFEAASAKIIVFTMNLKPLVKNQSIYDYFEAVGAKTIVTCLDLLRLHYMPGFPVVTCLDLPRLA